jgi:hypothetical protein
MLLLFLLFSWAAGEYIDMMMCGKQQAVWQLPTVEVCKWTIESKTLAHSLDWFKCGGVVLRPIADLRIFAFQVQGEALPWRVSIKLEETGTIRLEYFPDDPDLKTGEGRFSQPMMHWERAPCRLPKELIYEDVRVEIYHWNGRIAECSLA